MASGLPDRDALATYGGAKIDFAPVEDITTDESAAHRNLYATNVAAMTHTTMRAFRTFVGKASSPPDEPVSNAHDAVWGDATGVKPTCARTGVGVYTVTWPTSVTDELLVSHTVNIRRAWYGIDSTTAYIVNVTVTSSNVVTVRVFDAAGAANDAVGAIITVFVV